MGWEVAERFKRKGAYVCFWLIHVDVWQKPTQFYKANILQLKEKKTNPKQSNSSVIQWAQEKELGKSGLEQTACVRFENSWPHHLS